MVVITETVTAVDTITVVLTVTVVRAVTITETVKVADLQVLRLARGTRTVKTLTVMEMASVRADLTVADREETSRTVRVDRADLTVADREETSRIVRVDSRADRVVSDHVWVEELQLLFLLTSLASSLLKKLHLKAKNRYITAKTKNSTMIIFSDRRKRQKLQPALYQNQLILWNQFQFLILQKK